MKQKVFLFIFETMKLEASVIESRKVRDQTTGIFSGKFIDFFQNLFAAEVGGYRGVWEGEFMRDLFED
jgi:hypothetical protein